MLGWLAAVLGPQGPDSGSPPAPAPGPALPSARPALPAGSERSAARTMRRFQTWLRSRAGRRQPGREGRKKPVGPRLRLTSPSRAGGPRLGGRDTGQGLAPRALGERRHRWALGLQEALCLGGRLLAESPLLSLMDQNSPKERGSQEHKRPL